MTIAWVLAGVIWVIAAILPNILRAATSLLDEASTPRRVFRSMHISDLRLIFRASSTLVLSGIGAGVILFVMGTSETKSPYRINIVQFCTLIAALLAAWGTVSAWCYQTAAKRLGIVDLFASEIGVLCRVMAIVDVGPRLIRSFQQSEADLRQSVPMANVVNLKRFTAQENYTPVFDGNVADLQALDATSVRRATEFYTYRKAMLDYMRRVAEETPFAAPDVREDPWHFYMLQVIYLLFLSAESARLAIDKLIEFQPNKIENTINILLTELPSWRFLLDCFDKTDLRHLRLKLRRRQYETLYKHIQQQYQVSRRAGYGAQAEAWRPVQESFDALTERYVLAMDGSDGLRS